MKAAVRQDAAPTTNSWMGAGGPRVLFVSHSAVPSGAELSLLTLLPALRGTRTRVLLCEDGPLVGLLAGRGIPVEVLPLPDQAAEIRRTAVVLRRLPLSALLGSAMYVLRLRRRLAELRPDIVDTGSMKAHLLAGIAARSLRIPHVWHAHDRIAADYLGPTAVRLVRTAVRWLPSAVVANSRSTLETLRLTRRVPARVVPVAVPLHPRSDRRDGRFVVGHVGRLAPWKGQDVFLRAFARAFPEGGARAVVVGAAWFGEQDYAAWLEVLARDLGMSERISFVGHADDVAAHLAGFEVLVHSSVIPEPFGQVVVEGMSAGLAVIAAADGGPAELIENGRTGLLVSPGDVDALTGALLRLAGDPELRRRLGEEARPASLAYLPEAVAASLEGFYAELLEVPG